MVGLKHCFSLTSDIKTDSQQYWISQLARPKREPALNHTVMIFLGQALNHMVTIHPVTLDKSQNCKGIVVIALVKNGSMKTDLSGHKVCGVMWQVDSIKQGNGFKCGLRHDS